jgi:hypothetical protein
MNLTATLFLIFMSPFILSVFLVGIVILISILSEVFGIGNPKPKL